MILRNSTVAPRNGIYKHWPKISVSSGSRTTVLKEFPHVFDLRRELTLLPSSVGSNARMQREKWRQPCSHIMLIFQQSLFRGKSWKSKEHGCWLDGCKILFSLSFTVILPGMDSFFLGKSSIKTTVWLCKGPEASIVLTPSSSNFDSRPFKRRLAEGWDGWLTFCADSPR